MLNEFKPSLFFLGKFLAVYLAGNIIYGLWVRAVAPQADSMTKVMTEQTSLVLNTFGENTSVVASDHGPTMWLQKSSKTILNVFEGCNGINVMIVFLAFIVAFGGALKKMFWFVPAGLVCIHLFNLIRIALLYVVAQHYQRYFYYVHKYIFTAFLYLIVLMLWGLWVAKLSGEKDKADD